MSKTTQEKDSALLAILSYHTQEEVRAIATSIGVPHGRNKSETVNNIINSGKTDELRIVLR